MIARRQAMMAITLIIHPLEILSLGRGPVCGSLFCGGVFGRRDACLVMKYEAAEKKREARATPILRRNCRTGSCKKLMALSPLIYRFIGSLEYGVFQFLLVCRKLRGFVNGKPLGNAG